jgi:hypothetical protein
MIGNVDMLGLITNFEIVSNVNRGLIVTTHGRINTRYIMFFNTIRLPALLFPNKYKQDIFGLLHRNYHRLVYHGTPTDRPMVERKKITGNVLQSV